MCACAWQGEPSAHRGLQESAALQYTARVLRQQRQQLSAAATPYSFHLQVKGFTNVDMSCPKVDHPTPQRPLWSHCCCAATTWSLTVFSPSGHLPEVLMKHPTSLLGCTTGEQQILLSVVSIFPPCHPAPTSLWASLWQTSCHFTLNRKYCSPVYIALCSLQNHSVFNWPPQAHTNLLACWNFPSLTVAQAGHLEIWMKHAPVCQASKSNIHQPWIRP